MRRDLNSRDAVDHAWCIVEAGKGDMMRQRVMLQADIGVQHRPFDFACPIHTKEIGEAEVATAATPLIVETCLMRRDEVSPTLDEGAELVALRVTECSKIRQDQRPIRSNMRSVEQAIMHHLERYPRFNERLVPAECIVLHLGVSMSLAVVPGRLLRVGVVYSQQTAWYYGEWQIFRPPGIDFLHAVAPTIIF